MDKKVIHIIDNLDTGGAQRLLEDLTDGFKKHQVIALRGGRLEDGFPGRKIVGLNFLAVYKIYKIIKQEKPDIVHTHLWRSDVYMAILNCFLNISWVVTQHGINLGVEGKVKHFLKNIILKRAKFIIAISQGVIDYLDKYFSVPAEKIKLIYNGANEHKFVFSDYPQNKVPIIVCLGRLAKVKGQDILIKVLAEMKNKGFECWFIGDGPERNNLINLVKHYNLEDKINFLGHKYNIPEILAQANIVVIPSRQEGLSLAAIESGFSARPVVAHKVGGLKEVIKDKETGFLVEFNNKQEFKNKIKLLLNDQKLAKSMGIKAHEHVKNNFSFTKMLKQYRDFYENITN